MTDARWYLTDDIPPDMVLRGPDGFVRGDGKPLTPEQEEWLVYCGEAVRTPDGLRPNGGNGWIWRGAGTA